ncbi:hypothetical protein Anas_02337 [Armadillidium nasatum]|uniref:Uncharacterized protein n=1 Tax=Armadillidium nasatum TaxID=96803 RepID=A0A5N5STG3_9CRUS|nr:hypothetical protein Anas_02337 [Armadillidium nasatum]
MGQQINVKSKSEGENEDTPENFTLYAEKSPRKKKFVTNLDDYPKFIKLVKSPVPGRRHGALIHEPLPPHLIPQQMSMSYPSSGSFHVLQPQQINRFSNQQSPRVAYVDWVPQHRIPNYNSHPNNDLRNNLYKSYSYDGYSQNLAHIPLVRRNSQYFIASSPQGYLVNDKNFYSRNTHDDRVLVGNRGVSNSSQNLGPSQVNSIPASQHSTASSNRSTQSGSEFYYPKEMDVETVERFRDANGTLIRLVKPIGSSTRIFNKANAPQMFMIVDQPNDYVTHAYSSPGRFVSDEREEDRISNRSNNSEENSIRRSNNSEENSIRRSTNSEERSSNREENSIRRSRNSEENSIRRSNNSEVNSIRKRSNIEERSSNNEENRSSSRRSNNGEEFRRSRRSNHSQEREDIPEADEGHQEEKEEHEVVKEEEEEVKIEEETGEELEKEEKSPKVERESIKKKGDKSESLKLKKEMSKTDFKREKRASYKDKIAMAQEVDVS